MLIENSRMNNQIKSRSSDRLPNRLFLIWMTVWTLANSLTLTRFPYVHSDEPWLAGLSQAMLKAKSLLVTEPFFDVYPRQVHAMKLLYHAIQACFIKVLGYQVLSVRLISLLSGALVLMMLFHYGKKVFEDSRVALFLSVLAGLHIQFIYASHLARQEMLLMAALVMAAIWMTGVQKAPHWLAPLVIGLSALIHPNALVVATMIGLVLLKNVLTRRMPWRRLFQFIGILSVCAAVLVGLSLFFTPEFLDNYARFGATLAVDADPISRWQNLISFFVKLGGQISGTYWLPDLRFWFALTVVVVPASVLALLTSGEYLNQRNRTGLVDGLCLFAGYLIATFVIGRNNPTSILFALFPLVILVGHLIQSVGQAKSRLLRTLSYLAACGVLTAGLFGSIQSVRPFLNSKTDPYETYLEEIRSNLPRDAVVLGNLSAGFALEDVAFFDIRNLDAIATGLERPVTKADLIAYIRERRINTVIWYEEYEYILRNPQWRILYEDQPDGLAVSEPLTLLNQILTESGNLIHEFESPVYGTRIIRFMGDYPWKVSLISLDPKTIS